jgi:hypothetical protein
MKKSIFAFLLVAFSLSAFAQHTKKELTGKWEGTDRGNEAGALVFKDNGKVDLKLGARLLHDLDYKVDLTKTPAPLDIVIKTLDGKQQVTLKCLIQFTDNNTLKWQIFQDDNRPSDSKSLSNAIALSDAITIILKRKKT